MELIRCLLLLVLVVILVVTVAIVYWIITILSTFQSLVLAKFYGILYMHDGGLEYFTNMTFFFMATCTKIYSAYLFTLQQQRFARMLRSMNALRAFARKYSKVKEPRFKMKWVVALYLVSLTISMLSVIFAFRLIGWTPWNLFLDRSQNTAMLVTIWTPEGLEANGTDVFEELKTNFGTNLTPKNMVLGTGGFVMQFCNRMQTEATGDLILLTAITLQQQIFQLAREVGNPENDIFPVTLENFEAEGGQWAHYLLLENAVDDANDTYDCLLKYLHVNNVTLCVYLILNGFDYTLSVFVIIYLLFNVIKASCTYRIATKACEKNEIFREWIRRLAGNSSDSKFTTRAFLILDRLKEKPLGLGKGQFMIDEGFMFRFYGTVGSVFVLQAQSREAE